MPANQKELVIQTYWFPICKVEAMSGSEIDTMVPSRNTTKAIVQRDTKTNQKAGPLLFLEGTSWEGVDGDIDGVALHAPCVQRIK